MVKNSQIIEESILFSKDPGRTGCVHRRLKKSLFLNYTTLYKTVKKFLNRITSWNMSVNVVLVGKCPFGFHVCYIVFYAEAILYLSAKRSSFTYESVFKTKS